MTTQSYAGGREVLLSCTRLPQVVDNAMEYSAEGLRRGGNIRRPLCWLLDHDWYPVGSYWRCRRCDALRPRNPFRINTGPDVAASAAGKSRLNIENALSHAWENKHGERPSAEPDIPESGIHA